MGTRLNYCMTGVKNADEGIFFSFDGDGEVVSRVRRGVLSLRVVRQMLS